MLNRFILGAVALASLTYAAVPAPANAASLVTDAFLTNANQDVDFLDRSSRLALTNSHDAKVKAFAYDQARNQTLTANALGDWIKADLGTQGDQVATGRSVAIDGSASTTTREMAMMSPPAGQEDLDNLEGLTGKEFDAIYKARQLATLGQLKALYTAYQSSGDDATLVSIAKRELPKITKQIAELSRS